MLKRQVGLSRWRQMSLCFQETLPGIGMNTWPNRSTSRDEGSDGSWWVWTNLRFVKSMEMNMETQRLMACIVFLCIFFFQDPFFCFHVSFPRWWPGDAAWRRKKDLTLRNGPMKTSKISTYMHVGRTPYRNKLILLSPKIRSSDYGWIIKRYSKKHILWNNLVKYVYIVLDGRQNNIPNHCSPILITTLECLVSTHP